MYYIIIVSGTVDTPKHFSDYLIFDNESPSFFNQIT